MIPSLDLFGPLSENLCGSVMVFHLLSSDALPNCGPKGRHLKEETALRGSIHRADAFWGGCVRESMPTLNINAGSASGQARSRCGRTVIPCLGVGKKSAAKRSRLPQRLKRGQRSVGSYKEARRRLEPHRSKSCVSTVE